MNQFVFPETLHPTIIIDPVHGSRNPDNLFIPDTTCVLSCFFTFSPSLFLRLTTLRRLTRRYRAYARPKYYIIYKKKIRTLCNRLQVAPNGFTYIRTRGVVLRNNTYVSHNNKYRNNNIIYKTFV